MSDTVAVERTENTALNGLTSFVRALGATRMAAMGAVAICMIGFFMFVIYRFNQPQMSVLYADLPFEDSVEIVKKLEGSNIPHQIRQDGAIILVPRDQVMRLRMRMAEDGLPQGGNIGYEIFDKGNTLGATNFVQNINHLRAIEGELARSIKSLNRVSQARVHLVIPKQKLFSQRNAKPSASIVIKSRGELGGGQIRAIQHLVASAVEGMQANHVSIVDENGRLLAAGTGDDDAQIATGALADKSRQYEKRLARDIEEIVARFVGEGKVRVRVTAELDYNRVTKTSDVFDPNGQVVRSSQTIEESNNSTSASSNKAVTVGNELPNADGGNKSNGESKEQGSKTEEKINYEISKTRQVEVIEAGGVKRLSVAVLVDGTYNKDKDGKVNYQPRNSKELEEIAQLVRSATGFNKERGDQLHVSNLKFAATEEQILDDQEASLFDFSKDDYFYIAELVVTLLISLFLILFILRPLVKRILTPEDPADIIDLAEEKATPVIMDQSGNPVSIETLEGLQTQIAESNKTFDTLNNAKATGEVHAKAIKQIGDLVNKNPTEAATVVRQWLDQGVA